MSCYFHPDRDGVVVCGNCGVAMCHECETNAFFRLDNGKGQALCNRCSLNHAQEIVDFESSFIKSRLRKIIICAVLIIVGLLPWVVIGDDVGTAFVLTLICWGLAGIIQTWGQKDNRSVKEQVKDAAYEYDHPITNWIFSIVFHVLFSPIYLLANLIGYFRDKSEYREDLANLNAIKDALNISETSVESES